MTRKIPTSAIGCQLSSKDATPSRSPCKARGSDSQVACLSKQLRQRRSEWLDLQGRRAYTLEECLQAQDHLANSARVITNALSTKPPEELLSTFAQFMDDAEAVAAQTEVLKNQEHGIGTLQYSIQQLEIELCEAFETTRDQRLCDRSLCEGGV